MIDERKRDQKNEGKASTSSYKGVVREEELFDYDQNAIVAVFNKLFVTGRKLKPVVK